MAALGRVRFPQKSEITWRRFFDPADRVEALVACQDDPLVGFCEVLETVLPYKPSKKSAVSPLDGL
jgi:hypothetical protein